MVLLSALLIANHPVGEPRLEQSQIWSTCCEEDDCFAVPWQAVRDMGEKTLIQLEGFATPIDTGKIHPAPTTHHWLCLFNRNGNWVDGNIRCLLYPERVNYG